MPLSGIVTVIRCGGRAQPGQGWWDEEATGSALSSPLPSRFDQPRGLALPRLRLSFRDVELILAGRGVVVSYESMRRWCLKFGASFANSLADVGSDLETNGTWMRSSSGSRANCTIPGAPSIKTGSGSTSWCKVAAMQGQPSASSSGFSRAYSMCRASSSPTSWATTAWRSARFRLRLSTARAAT
jgi:hypothetical protein